MLVEAVNKGATIISNEHLKFKRLLGELMTIVTDTEKEEWLVFVHYGHNTIYIEKAHDTMESTGMILKPIKQYLLKGIHSNHILDISYFRRIFLNC